MIKLNKFAFMGAIALGAVGFTACSSDDLADDPGKNPSLGDAVKTQFAINIPAGGAGTRLGTDVVQGQDEPKFRGMTNIRLVPFINIAAAESSNVPLAGTDEIEENALLLSDIAATGGLTTGTENSYKIYNDINLKLNTNAFLFYGEALAKDGGDAVNGALVPSYIAEGWVDKALNTLHFDLKPIADASKNEDNEKSQEDMKTILNGIAGAEGWSETTDESLKSLYESFISLTAGSSNSIRATVQYLYNALQDPKSGIDESANTVKDAVIAKIEEYFTASGEVTEKTLAFNGDYAGYETTGYPTNIGLPDGAVQVDFAENAFTYVTTDINYNPSATETAMNVAALGSYVYPASLYYWTNTACRVANESKSAEYNGNTAWGELMETIYGTTNGKVIATTRSVGLVNQINYAVGRFDLNVKFASGELADNGANWPATGVDDADRVTKNVSVPAEGITMTGVLVGGQKNVGWDFAQLASDDTEKTIFDCKLGTEGNGVGVKAGTAVKVHTLALQTKKKETSGEEKANFALEFVNNTGEDFVGHDGIVPAGGKFYLVGQLTTNANGDGETVSDYIFEQDHTTIANVTINSLKSAYNCIPDLRTPGLELGLSVDLEWQSGLVDNVTIE